MAATALVLIALGGATHNRERGIVTNVAWSRDGASIFYDRMADAPRGIYSVPAAGRRRAPGSGKRYRSSLPDGSLLVVKLNGQRKLQLFWFWTDRGRLQTFP